VTYQIVGSDGQSISVPDELARELLDALAAGRHVELATFGESIRVSEAAALLGLTSDQIRQMLVVDNLTDVPATACVTLASVLAYRQLRRERRLAGLAEMARITSETGGYDADVPPLRRS